MWQEWLVNFKSTMLQKENCQQEGLDRRDSTEINIMKARCRGVNRYYYEVFYQNLLPTSVYLCLAEKRPTDEPVLVALLSSNTRLPFHVSAFTGGISLLTFNLQSAVSPIRFH